MRSGRSSPPTAGLANSGYLLPPGDTPEGGKAESTPTILPDEVWAEPEDDDDDHWGTTRTRLPVADQLHRPAGSFPLLSDEPAPAPFASPVLRLLAWALPAGARGDWLEEHLCYLLDTPGRWSRVRLLLSLVRGLPALAHLTRDSEWRTSA